MKILCSHWVTTQRIEKSRPLASRGAQAEYNWQECDMLVDSTSDAIDVCPGGASEH